MSVSENRLANQMFLQKVASENEKLGSEAGAYIRSKLREVGFARKILPPQYVTPGECQRSVYHDQLVRIVDKEPDSHAMTINFRGQPNSMYIEGERFEVSFFNITTDEFEKAEEELLAYEIPIMDVLERQIVKEIQRVEDSNFISACNTAITSTGNSSTVTNSAAFSGSIDPNVFVTLFNILEDTGGSQSSNPLLCDSILMNQADYNNLLLWQAQYAGDDFATMVLTEGMKYPMIMGKKVYTTIKGDLVAPGTVYGFASPEYLGKFYLMGDLRFYIDKKRNIVQWSALETLGMALGNLEGVAKVTYQD